MGDTRPAFGGSHYDSELAQLRIKSKLSLHQVQELTCIKYNTLSQWEGGAVGKIMTKNIEPAIKLCELYGISMNSLENMIASAYIMRRQLKKESFGAFQSGVKVYNKAIPAVPSTNKPQDTRKNASDGPKKALRDTDDKKVVIDHNELLRKLYGHVSYDEYLYLRELMSKKETQEGN